MTFLAVHNAIRKKFDEDVVTAGHIASDLVSWDNALFDEEDDDVGSLWCRFNVIAGDSQIRELGSLVARTNGFAVASVFILAGVGDNLGLTLADNIVAAFKGTTYTSGGATVVFRTPSVTPVRRQSAWWQINVTLPFFTESA
jgi:hypothetical protein